MFEFILGSADVAVERYVFSTWEGFIDRSEVLVTSLLVIFVALVGYLLWIGRIEMSRSEMLVRGFQAAVIFVFATNVDVLDRFLYRVATDVPGAVASSMVAPLGESSGSINESLDLVFVDGMRTGGKILDEASIYDVGTVLFGFVMIFVTLVALIPVALVLLLSKVAVGVLLGLAPIVLLLYLFPATRSLFEGYVRQLLGFALIPVMIYALLGLVLSMVQSVPDAVVQESLEGIPSLGVIAPYIVVMIVVGLLSTQVLSWSSGIAGALTLSAAGALARPAAAASGTLSVLQAGSRASRVSSSETGRGRVAAFTGGALPEATGLRPPRATIACASRSAGVGGVSGTKSQPGRRSEEKCAYGSRHDGVAIGVSRAARRESEGVER